MANPRRPDPSAPSERSQRREQLSLRPGDELRLLIGADLHERDLGEAGVDERPDLLDVLTDVRPAGQRIGDLLGGNELSRALERVRVG